MQNEQVYHYQYIKRCVMLANFVSSTRVIYTGNQCVICVIPCGKRNGDKCRSRKCPNSRFHPADVCPYCCHLFVLGRITSTDSIGQSYPSSALCASHLHSRRRCSFISTPSGDGADSIKLDYVPGATELHAWWRRCDEAVAPSDG